MSTAGGPVLVVLDQGAGAPRAAGALPAAAAELATLGREVAAGLGGELHVVVGAADAATEPPVLLETLARYGVHAVHRVPDAPTPAAAATALTQVLRESGARVLLAASTFWTKEVAAVLGVRTGAGVLVDAARLEVADGHLVAERTSFAGTWTSRCRVLAWPAVVTVRPHATTPREADEPTRPRDGVVVEDVPAERVTVAERTPQPGGDGPDLASADVVVVAGRGTGGDLVAVTELARELGAALGATRDVVDEGWAGHEAQVGQTGVTIHPKLYLGLGVSGAVHHVGGMRAAGTVVAVNTDPDAPIFEIADYGVVGDLRDVVPQLLDALRRGR